MTTDTPQPLTPEEEAALRDREEGLDWIGANTVIDRLIATLDRDRERIAALEGALREIDNLPTGHLRRNGFASPDPWVRQREVRRIVRRALTEEPRHDR